MGDDPTPQTNGVEAVREGGQPAPSLASLGEFGLIDRLASVLPPNGSDVVLGIGDDAAVLEWGDRTLLATTDVLLEGVHFRTDWTSPSDLGWKALAVNLSDIAAMGGVPNFALISLGLPSHVEIGWAEELYRGLSELSRFSGCALIGGDTVRSPDRIYLNLTVVGEAVEGRFAARSGARPGDVLLVTGTLGESVAGYHALKRSEEEPSASGREGKSEEGFSVLPTGVSECLSRHYRPLPRLEAGHAAVKTGFVHAMMDLSDGLSGDVRHLAGRSGVGVRLRPDRLPISDALREAAAYLNRDAVQLALSGGEDYELLMAVPPEGVDAVREAVESLGLPLTAMGEATDRVGEIVLVLPDGGVKAMPSLSWDHFS